MKTSKHYQIDRQQREKIIQEIGVGKIVAVREVDNHHRNGKEIHYITSNGIIIIKNKRSNKLITKLIARPNQIKRYFDQITPEIDAIIEKAYQHKRLRLNES